MSITKTRCYATLLWFTLMAQFTVANAAESAVSEFRAALAGHWVINERLSENTDDQVEAAIRRAGGKPPRRWFNNNKEFFRGGPPEQELYDRISYDLVLEIRYDEPEFRFTYADDYVRVFHTDGRRRQTTANDFFSEGGQDFSFGNFDGDKLIVEARPRDGGFTLETYTLQANGSQLRVELVAEPDNFGAAINLVRVYDRASSETP
jgi:hypothetical protein